MLGSEPSRLDLIGVLRICSARSAYRKRYRGDLNLRNVADFLLFSQDFPRSVRFAIRRIDSNLHDISGVPAGNFSNEAERLTGSALAQFNFSGIDAMLETGLHASIDQLQKKLIEVGQSIFETYENYEYCVSTTTVATHANEVLQNKRGVCQDFAHAAIALCRCLGIPARYVSGYFYDATRDQSMRGAGASHAWLEIMVNGYGWFGLDPTNNRVVDETYVILGSGRDYTDVAPVTGTYFGPSPESLQVSVEVKRLD